MKTSRENMFAWGGEYFRPYRCSNQICLTQDLLFRAAAIKFKGSDIHFPNETIIFFLRNPSTCPKRKQCIPHFLLSFHVYDGKQRTFTVQRINAVLLLNDLVEFDFTGEFI